MSYGGNITGDGLSGHFTNNVYTSTDLASLTDSFFDGLVVNYSSAAGFVVYLYDLFLTFDDEIEFFWKYSGGWLIRLLYLTNRYLPFPSLLTTIFIINSRTFGNKAVCQLALLSSIICEVFASAVTAAIFSLRVLTIYKSSYSVRGLIIFSFWTSALALMVLMVFDLAWMSSIVDVKDGACLVVSDFTKPARATVGLYLAPLFCEVVVLGATLRHALDSHRNRQTLNMSRVSPVLRRLYNDGFAYFFIVFTLRVFSCLIWFFAPTNLKYSSDYLSHALTSIATSRFFLALRRSINESISLTDITSNSKLTSDGFGGTLYFAAPIFSVSTGSTSQENNSRIESLKSPYVEMEGIRKRSADGNQIKTLEYQPMRPHPP